MQPTPLSRLAADLSTDRLAAGTRDNLAGIVLERVFGVGLIVTLPLLLSPAALGQYYEAVAVITIAGILALLGMDVGVVRFTAVAAEQGRFGEIRRWLGAGVVVSAVISTVIVAGLLAAAPWLARRFDAPGLEDAIRIGAVAIPFLAGAALLVSPARGLKSMRPAVLAIQIVQPALQLGLVLVLVWLVPTVSTALATFTLAAAAAFATSAVLLRRLRLPGRDPRLQAAGRSPTWTLVRFAAPIGGMALTDTALLWVSTLLLAAYRPPAHVAGYGLVVRLMTMGMAVLFTVIQIFSPFAAQLLARGDLSRLEELLRLATRWSVLLGAPVLCLAMVTGSRAIGLLGLDEGEARAAILVLVPAFLVDIFTGPVGSILTMSGRSGLNLANNLVALVANVALNLVLIPRLGASGAAAAWAVAIVGVNVARVVQVRSLFGIHPFSRSLLGPAACAAVASLAAAVALRLADLAVPGTPALAPVLAVLAFAVAYAIALRSTGLQPEDRFLVSTLLGRVRRSA